MDTGASSHLADNTCMLTSFSNLSIYPSVFVGNGNSIPVTHTGHSFLHTSHKPLHLNHILVTPHIIKNLISVHKFTRDNDVSVEFDAYGFSIKDYQTQKLLLRCDSTGDLYPVTQQPPLQTPVVLLSLSSTTWNRRLGHPREDVLRRLESISRDWPIHQLDVKNAFLHGHLSETIYIHQPPGFVDPNKPGYVCHLQRSLYGLKQALRAWFQRFASYAIRVNDINLTASSSAFLQRIIASLHSEFSMTDLGSLNYFLGISAQRSASGLFLSQSKFAEEILEQDHMQNCNPCQTPVDTKSKLGSDGDPVSDLTLYRSLAGALQYLIFTHPDLSHAIQQVCLYMHDPRDPHFTALKRILRYVRGTLDYGLQLHVSSTTQLTAYTDADWAGCPVTRRSTSGYCVFLGDNLLSWSAKRQVTLSRSSAEAEYRGVANVVAETAWIRNLLCELHTPLFTATLVYCDNVSAVYMSANPVQHQRTKHIEIDIHFVRDFVASGQVRVLHVPSRFQCTIKDQYTGLEAGLGEISPHMEFPDKIPSGDRGGFGEWFANRVWRWRVAAPPQTNPIAILNVTLSRSSAEAEYRGVANVVAETAWIRNLLRALYTPLFTATLVYCDNVSAVYMSANPVQHHRTKHIKIDIHFVRDFVASGQVRVLHVPSRFQYADIFTKGLPTALFFEFRTKMLPTIQRSQQVISIMGQIQYSEKYFDDTFEYRHVVLPPKVNTHGEEEDGESVEIRFLGGYCEKDDWGLLSISEHLMMRSGGALGLGVEIKNMRSRL
ncbi:ribonuclease H-like domain-containing protein [Tanacetum coccineum]